MIFKGKKPFITSLIMLYEKQEEKYLKEKSVPSGFDESYLFN